jgi:hypothetical protein
MRKTFFFLLSANLLLTINFSCSGQRSQNNTSIDSVRNLSKNSSELQAFPDRINLGSPISKEIGLLKKVLLEKKKVNTIEDYQNDSFSEVKYFFDPKNCVVLRVETDYPAILFEKYNYNSDVDLTRNYQKFYERPMVGFMQNNQIYIGTNAITAYENHTLFPIKFNQRSHNLIEKIDDRQFYNYQLLNKVVVDSLELKYGSNRVYFKNDWNLLKTPKPRNEFYEKIAILKNSIADAAQKKEH